MDYLGIKSVEDNSALFSALEEFEVRQKFLQQTACQLVLGMWGAVPQADVDYMSGYDAHFLGDNIAEILRMPFKTGL